MRLNHKTVVGPRDVLKCGHRKHSMSRGDFKLRANKGLLPKTVGGIGVKSKRVDPEQDLFKQDQHPETYQQISTCTE